MLIYTQIILHNLISIMKNLTIFTAIALMLLGVSNVKAQFSNVYQPSNGQDTVVVSSTVKGLDSTKIGYRIGILSNNASMTPIIGSYPTGNIVDSFMTNQTNFVYTIPVSVNYPKYFYFKEIVTSKDTVGKIDTATGVSYLPVLLTPKLKAPTMWLTTPTVGKTTALFNATFTSGFDKAKIEIIISYGDTIFSHPVTKYPIKDSVDLVLGQNQDVARSYSIDLGSSNYMFSYKVHIWNSVLDSLSPIFYGVTLPQASPVKVGTPSNSGSTDDSIWYESKIVTNGLKTYHTAFISETQNGTPFDSVNSVIFGNSGISIKNISFIKLKPENDYYVWSAVYDTAFKTWFYSNKVLVQTKSSPSKYTLKINSLKVLNRTSEDAEVLNFNVITPDGSVGYTTCLIREYPNGNSTTVQQWRTTQGQENLEAILENLTIGKKYQVTIFGYDSLWTNHYNAWEIEDTFTFKGTQTIPSLQLQSMGTRNLNDTLAIDFSVFVPSGYTIDIGYKIAIGNDSTFISPYKSGIALSKVSGFQTGTIYVTGLPSGTHGFYKIYNDPSFTPPTGELKGSFNYYKNISSNVSELQNALNFSLYPNPSQDIINIEIPEGKISDYEMYDINGKKVLKGNLKNSQTQISVSELEQGLYFIKTKFGMIKFLKN